MRCLWAIPLLLAGCLRAQNGSAAGTVVDQNGKPVAGVHLRLINGEFDELHEVYGVNSDAAGRFAVDEMKPGLYFVMAERAGYLQDAGASPMGMTFLPLKPGQHVTDRKVTMVERAVLLGRVVDEFGDPVPNVQVQVAPANSNSAPGPFLFGGQSATDDRGEFRILTLPGRYYVKAEIERMQNEPEIRTDGTSGEPFTTTYFPSAASTAAASVVQVGAGQDAAGIEIHMQRQGPGEHSSGFTVSGTVTGAPDKARPTVALRFGDKPGEEYDSNNSATDGEGKFRFMGMEPGYYALSASYQDGKTTLHSRIVEFHLESGDQTSVQLALAPGEELTGQLEILGDPAAGEAAKHAVRLASENVDFGDNDLPSAEVAEDGSFHLRDVSPGKYKLLVEPMPENGFVKEIALDGKALLGGVLDFRQGVSGSRVKLTVSRAGGEISGRVLYQDGDLVSSRGFAMVFFGSDPEHMDGEDMPLRVKDGTYSLKGIAPGKYRIIALDVGATIQATSGDGDNDAMKARMFAAAEEIEIKEGDRIVKDLTAQSKLPDKKEAP